MQVNMKRLAVAVVAAASAVFATAGPASAGVLVASAHDCPVQSLSQPFARWGDLASYTLLAGGDVEGSLGGWTTSGSARAVDGNEPWNVGGSGDHRSLSLPAGSSALTAPICVGLEHPTLRFFARKQSGLLTTLAVSVRVKTSVGLIAEIPVGVVLAGSSWAPTPQQLVVANLLPLVPGQYTAVQFRFTPLLGSWQVDDVYVDPFRRA
jgi:hypothetical protein